MRPYRDFVPDRRLWPVLGLSPDGTEVAYIDDATGQFNLAVRPVGGGAARQVTAFTDQQVRALAWHPDGRSLVVTADVDGDEQHQVFLVDAAGGEPRALTDNRQAQFNLGFGPPFSPDGRRLAYAGNDRTRTDQDVLVRDLDTGEVWRLVTDAGFTFPGFWSPDGSRLSAVQVRDLSDHELYLVPLDGGEARTLSPAEPPASYLPGPWLPDGSGFVVCSNAGREFTGLARIDATTGELSWQQTPEHDVDLVARSADGRVLAWLVNVDGAAQLRAQDLSTGAPIDTPTLPVGVAAGIDVSSDGRWVALLLGRPTYPPNVVVVDLDSGELRPVTDAAPAGVEPSELIEPELVRYPTRDGGHVPAWLYRPRSSEPVGVVMALHGGPSAQERPGYRPLYQHLLHHGVAVLAPNVGGSTGYGKSYMRRVFRDWGGQDLDDFTDGAHWLRKQDWVDPARIGLYGGSYGGFAVLSLVARRPELDWAAAVDVCGISNLVTLARSSPPTWRAMVSTMIGDPDTDEEFLRSRSPITYADQIRAPLFILQGANDPRVPQHESDQIVEALRARGVPVRYDVYPDEGHGFTKRHNQLQADSDSAEFLIGHLIG
jgi:dipeptidyl aminopeptidase/acylaminoacyl peptidase